MHLEDHVERHFVNRVRDLGGMHRKADTPGNRFLDRIVVLPGGEVWFVELKRPKGPVRAHQAETMRRLRELGANVALLYTKEEVDDWADDNDRQARGRRD